MDNPHLLIHALTSTNITWTVIDVVTWMSNSIQQFYILSDSTDSVLV